jgi:hypothetical protein
MLTFRSLIPDCFRTPAARAGTTVNSIVTNLISERQDDRLRGQQSLRELTQSPLVLDISKELIIHLARENMSINPLFDNNQDALDAHIQILRTEYDDIITSAVSNQVIRAILDDNNVRIEYTPGRGERPATLSAYDVSALIAHISDTLRNHLNDMDVYITNPNREISSRERYNDEAAKLISLMEDILDIGEETVQYPRIQSLISRVFDRLNRQVIPFMRRGLPTKQLRLTDPKVADRRYSSLPKAAHWLAYTLMPLSSEQLVEKRLRTLVRLSPEASALMLGMIGMHNREKLDLFDFDASLPLYAALFKAIEESLASGNKERAGDYFVAILNGFNFNATTLDGDGFAMFKGRINNAMDRLGRYYYISQPTVRLEKYMQVFRDRIRENKESIRLYRRDFGDENVEALNHASDHTSAYDVVTGRKKNPRSSRGGRVYQIYKQDEIDSKLRYLRSMSGAVALSETFDTAVATFNGKPYVSVNERS